MRASIEKKALLFAHSNFEKKAFSPVRSRDVKNKAGIGLSWGETLIRSKGGQHVVVERLGEELLSSQQEDFAAQQLFFPIEPLMLAKATRKEAQSKPVGKPSAPPTQCPPRGCGFLPLLWPKSSKNSCWLQFLDPRFGIALGLVSQF